MKTLERGLRRKRSMSRGFLKLSNYPVPYYHGGYICHNSTDSTVLQVNPAANHALRRILPCQCRFANCYYTNPAMKYPLQGNCFCEQRLYKSSTCWESTDLKLVLASILLGSQPPHTSALNPVFLDLSAICL